MSAIDARPTPQERSTPCAPLVALHLLAAVLLGIFADLGTGWGTHMTDVAIAATPWVVLVFSAGRVSGLRWAPLVGAATLAVGLGAYYGWLHFGKGVSLGILTGSGFNGMIWLSLGGLVGVLAGVVGAFTRLNSWWAEFAWAGLIAMPVVEGVLLLTHNRPAPIFSALLLWGTTTALLAWWALRAGARGRVLTILVPLACFVVWRMEVTVLQQALGRLN